MAQIETTPTLLPPGLPEFLEGFAIVHRSMRRDARRLVALAGRSAPVDAAGLQRWWARFEAEVVHHHEREDEIVWPELVARAPEFGADLGQLEADHHGLDAAMADVRSAIGSLAAAPTDPARRAQLERTAAAFETLLFEHLEREEAAAFPLLARTFTPAGYAELEEQLRKGSSIRQLAFELPWAADELPAEVVDRLWQDLPAPIRLAHRLAFLPSYRRIVAPLLGVAR